MRGNYSTDQRNIIESYLKENESKFLSCQEILDYIEKENKAEIGLTTIYRFLNLLEKNNKVRVEIKNHTKFYQYISDECSKHFHLKCRICGKIIHLKCRNFENLNNHIIKEHDFKIDNNTMIYGICGKCS